MPRQETCHQCGDSHRVELVDIKVDKYELKAFLCAEHERAASAHMSALRQRLAVEVSSR